MTTAAGCHLTLWLHSELIIKSVKTQCFLSFLDHEDSLARADLNFYVHIQYFFFKLSEIEQSIVFLPSVKLFKFWIRINLKTFLRFQTLVSYKLEFQEPVNACAIHSYTVLSNYVKSFKQKNKPRSLFHLFT